MHQRREFYFPAGIGGLRSAPTGYVLFLQDKNWNWAQSQWMNIQTANRWTTVTARVDEMARDFPGFDPSRIRTVGIKVTSNSLARGFDYSGAFYVDNVKGTRSPEIQFEFESPETRTEQELRDLGGFAQVVRWWLLSDLRACLEFDANNFVRRVQPGCFDDIEELKRLARSAKIYLMPVLFDFLMGAEPQVVDGVQIFGRADQINDPDKRRSLLVNGLSPILDRLDTPEIAAVDLFNEPEWLLLDTDIYMPPGKRPPEVKSGGVISLATMTQFLREVVALYRSKGLRAPLTLGSASQQWVTLWRDLPLDLAQFHVWTGPGQIDEGLVLNFAPPGIPTFIGEFTTRLGLSVETPCEILEASPALGYVSAFPWAYRAKDDASLPLLGETTRKCMSPTEREPARPTRSGGRVSH